MKVIITFAAVLVVSSAQFSKLGAQRVQPARLVPRPASPIPRPSVPVVTRVSSTDQNANVLRYDNEVGPDGTYSYVLEIDNGISAQAQGTLRDFGGNPPVIGVVAQGSFGWTSPEGQPIGITYTADENGYQPVGDAIPTSPPIPADIARAIEFIARNAQKK